MKSVLSVIGEAVGFIAICESFLIYFSQTRKRMLLFKLLSDSLWLVNFLCLGGYTGAVLNAVGICTVPKVSMLCCRRSETCLPLSASTKTIRALHDRSAFLHSCFG